MVFSPLKFDCHSLPHSRKLRCDASPGSCPLIEFCRFVPFPRVWCDTSFVDSFLLSGNQKSRPRTAIGRLPICYFNCLYEKVRTVISIRFSGGGMYRAGCCICSAYKHYAGLPPDKNKRFRSFRSNTAFLHPILLSASGCRK